MFGIFFGISQEGCCGFEVGSVIALPACSARYGVDICHAIVGDAAVRFGRRAKDAKSAKVEVKEVGRGVDASQGTIEFKVITLIVLYKTS